MALEPQEREKAAGGEVRRSHLPPAHRGTDFPRPHSPLREKMLSTDSEHGLHGLPLARPDYSVQSVPGIR